MSGRLGSVAVGGASFRGSASRRAVCTLPILGAGLDTRKSLEVSSYRPSDSGISLQNQTEGKREDQEEAESSEKSHWRCGAFLSQPDIRTEARFAVTILRTILSGNKNLRTNHDLRFGFGLCEFILPILSSY